MVHVPAYAEVEEVRRVLALADSRVGGNGASAGGSTEPSPGATDTADIPLPVRRPKRQ